MFKTQIILTTQNNQREMNVILFLIFLTCVENDLLSGKQACRASSFRKDASRVENNNIFKKHLVI